MSGERARTLIVGGAGFVGARMAARRVVAGDDVHVMVRSTTQLGRLAGLRDRLTLHAVGLDSRAALDRVLAEARPQTVYLLTMEDRRAAQPDLADAMLSLGADVGGLLNIIAACAAASPPPRVVVRASSLAEYGPIPAPYDEAQQEMPLNSYAAALVAGTCYARMLAPRLPFALVTARLALLYGPQQSDRFLVPQLIGHALAGKHIAVLRPFDRRDLMHVDDAVSGMEALAERPLAPIVNLATGHAPTMLEVAGRIFEMCSADMGLLDLGPRHPPGGTPDFRGSGALALRLLGWRPSITLEDGLARTIRSYAESRARAELAA